MFPPTAVLHRCINCAVVYEVLWRSVSPGAERGCTCESDSLRSLCTHYFSVAVQLSRLPVERARCRSLSDSERPSRQHPSRPPLLDVPPSLQPPLRSRRPCRSAVRPRWVCQPAPPSPWPLDLAGSRALVPQPLALAGELPEPRGDAHRGDDHPGRRSPGPRWACAPTRGAPVRASAPVLAPPLSVAGLPPSGAIAARAVTRALRRAAAPQCPRLGNRRICARPPACSWAGADVSDPYLRASRDWRAGQEEQTHSRQLDAER